MGENYEALKSSTVLGYHLPLFFGHQQDPNDYKNNSDSKRIHLSASFHSLNALIISLIIETNPIMNAKPIKENPIKSPMIIKNPSSIAFFLLSVNHWSVTTIIEAENVAIYRNRSSF